MAAEAPPSVDLEWQSFPTTSGPAAYAVPAPAPPPPPATVSGAVAPALNVSLTSLFSPAFYKTLFNVDTADVVARLRIALWPFGPAHFLAVAGANPDLYAPLWLAATLAFVIGASANLSAWLAAPSATVAGAAWHYDLRLATLALVTVYGFSLGAPAVLWIVLSYVGVGGLALVQLLCVYGYSLAVFVPATLMCTVPNVGVQWSIVLAATLISCAFVLKAVWPVIRDQAPPPQGRALVLSVFAAQLVFGILLKLYFF